MSVKQPATLMAAYDKESDTFSIKLTDPLHPSNDTNGLVGPDGEQVLAAETTSKSAQKRMKKIIKSVLKPRMDHCRRIHNMRERMCRRLQEKYPNATPKVEMPIEDLGGAYY